MANEVPRSSLTLRPVQPEDAESLHALLLAELPDIPVEFSRWLARWNWQYRDNPFRQGRPAGWVLTDGDRVAGHVGAVYVPVAAGDRRLTGAIIADYAVSQDALQAGGVFAGLQLAQAFFEGTAGCLRLATTANEKTGAVLARFGCRPVEWTREFWRAPTTLRQQVRTCRGGANRVVRRLMSGRLGLLGSPLIGAAYGICRHQPALPVPPGCRLDVGMPDLLMEAGSFWQSLTQTAPGERRATESFLGIERSREYLEWRYLRHPESSNIRSLLVRTRDGEVLGTAGVFVAAGLRAGRLASQITAVEGEDPSRRDVAFIEELVVSPDRPDVMHALVCAALRLACDHGAEYLICTAGRADLRGRFWECGFESRARSAPAVVIGSLPDTPQTPALESLLAAVRFHHGDVF